MVAQIDDLEVARIGELARADHCSQPTMTTQVQRLEELGWATRVTDPVDARAVLVSLTAEGRRLLGEVRLSRAAVVAPPIDRLSVDQQQHMAEALTILHQLLDIAATHDAVSRHPAAPAGSASAAAHFDDVRESH